MEQFVPGLGGPLGGTKRKARFYDEILEPDGDAMSMPKRQRRDIPVERPVLDPQNNTMNQTLQEQKLLTTSRNAMQDMPLQIANRPPADPRMDFLREMNRRTGKSIEELEQNPVVQELLKSFADKDGLLPMLRLAPGRSAKITIQNASVPIMPGAQPTEIGINDNQYQEVTVNGKRIMLPVPRARGSKNSVFGFNGYDPLQPNNTVPQMDNAELVFRHNNQPRVILSAMRYDASVSGFLSANRVPRATLDNVVEAYLPIIPYARESQGRIVTVNNGYAMADVVLHDPLVGRYPDKDARKPIMVSTSKTALLYAKSTLSYANDRLKQAKSEPQLATVAKPYLSTGGLVVLDLVGVGDELVRMCVLNWASGGNNAQIPRFVYVVNSRELDMAAMNTFVEIVNDQNTAGAQLTGVRAAAQTGARAVPPVQTAGQPPQQQQEQPDQPPEDLGAGPEDEVAQQPNAPNDGQRATGSTAAGLRFRSGGALMGGAGEDDDEQEEDAMPQPPADVDQDGNILIPETVMLPTVFRVFKNETVTRASFPGRWPENQKKPKLQHTTLNTPTIRLKLMGAMALIGNKDFGPSDEVVKQAIETTATGSNDDYVYYTALKTKTTNASLGSSNVDVNPINMYKDLKDSGDLLSKMALVFLSYVVRNYDQAVDTSGVVKTFAKLSMATSSRQYYEMRQVVQAALNGYDPINIAVKDLMAAQRDPERPDMIKGLSANPIVAFVAGNKDLSIVRRGNFAMADRRVNPRDSFGFQPVGNAGGKAVTPGAGNGDAAAQGAVQGQAGQAAQEDGDVADPDLLAGIDPNALPGSVATLQALFRQRLRAREAAAREAAAREAAAREAARTRLELQGVPDVQVQPGAPEQLPGASAVGDPAPPAFAADFAPDDPRLITQFQYIQELGGRHVYLVELNSARRGAGAVAAPAA